MHPVGNKDKVIIDDTQLKDDLVQNESESPITTVASAALANPTSASQAALPANVSSDFNHEGEVMKVASAVLPVENTSMRRICELIQQLGFKTEGSWGDLTLFDHILLKVGDEINLCILEEIFEEDMIKNLNGEGFVQSQSSNITRKDSLLFELINECKRLKISLSITLGSLHQSYENKTARSSEKDEVYEALMKINRKILDYLRLQMNKYIKSFQKMFPLKKLLEIQAEKFSNNKKSEKLIDELDRVSKLEFGCSIRSSLEKSRDKISKATNYLKDFVAGIRVKLPIMLSNYDREFGLMVNRKRTDLASSTDSLMQLAILKKQIETYKVNVEWKMQFIGRMKDRGPLDSPEFLFVISTNKRMIQCLNYLLQCQERVEVLIDAKTKEFEGPQAWIYLGEQLIHKEEELSKQKAKSKAVSKKAAVGTTSTKTVKKQAVSSSNNEVEKIEKPLENSIPNVFPTSLKEQLALFNDLLFSTIKAQSEKTEILDLCFKECKAQMRMGVWIFNLLCESLEANDYTSLCCLATQICMNLHLQMEQALKPKVFQQTKYYPQHHGLVSLLSSSGLAKKLSDNPDIHAKLRKHVSDFNHAMVAARFPLSSKANMQNPQNISEALKMILGSLELMEKFSKGELTIDTSTRKQLCGLVDFLFASIKNTRMLLISIYQQSKNEELLRLEAIISKNMDELAENFKKQIQTSQAAVTAVSMPDSIEQQFMKQRLLLEEKIAQLIAKDSLVEQNLLGNPILLLQEVKMELLRLQNWYQLSKKYPNPQFTPLYSYSSLCFNRMIELLHASKGIINHIDNFLWIPGHDLEEVNQHLAIDQTDVKQTWKMFNINREHYLHGQSDKELMKWFKAAYVSAKQEGWKKLGLKAKSNHSKAKPLILAEVIQNGINIIQTLIQNIDKPIE